MAIFTHQTGQNHYTTIKARTSDHLQLAHVSEQTIHLSEQSNLTLEIPAQTFETTISIYLEKGSQLIIEEFQPWQGSITWNIVLMEPYAKLTHTGRIRAITGQSQATWNVYHEAPYTESKVDMRAVLEGTTKLNQDVSLHVLAGRPGCIAHQSADILTLNPTAKAHIVPRLLVSTDTATCSHGARIRTLKPQDLFYLQTRGIAETEAREMVIRGLLER